MVSKRLLTAIAAAFALFAVASSGWAEYNRDTVVQVMRTNYAKLGEIKTAVAKGDYFTVAGAFFEIARGMHSIRDFTPKKGEEAHWEKTIDAVVTAAFRGVGAAAEKDAAAVNKYLQELQALNVEGHTAHK